jgi:methionyl-tRNA formyltransferase
MTRVVFMGTPEFAVPALSLLLQHHAVVGVVTQPDRPAGRGKQVQMSPVKQAALAAGVPVHQPNRLRTPEAQAALRDWQADIFIVAAFGQILPQAVLDIPPRGCLNIHASLLPRWRGAAPIQAAIRAGDAESGVTIMQMDAGLDTGPMLSRRSTPITPDETGQSLHDKLSVIGGELLIATLPGYLDGSITPQPQDDALMTFAPRIEKDEGRIDWTQPAQATERLVRAFTPWPGTFTYWDGRLLKVLAAALGTGRALPGQVVRTGDGIGIGTGDGLLLPLRVQLEGRAAVSIEAFTRGYPAFVGAVLGV